jgi:ABC-type molybdate transport system substrate-binding protein
MPYTTPNRSSAWLLLALLAAASAGCKRSDAGAEAAMPAPGDAIVVVADRSLAGPLQRISESWLAAGGKPVLIAVNEESVVEEQIVAGAPADVALLSDDARIERLGRAGHLATAPPTRLGFLGERSLRAVVVRGGKAGVQAGDFVAFLATKPAREQLAKNGVTEAPVEQAAGSGSGAAGAAPEGSR